MKTNQTLTVSFGIHSFEIEHKTMMGSLNEVWAIGNAYRVEKGKNPLDLSKFLRSMETLELIESIEEELRILPEDYLKSLKTKKLNSANPTEFNLEDFLEERRLTESSRLLKAIVSPLIITKEGRGGGTQAHLYLLLEAAGKLDAKLRLQMYKTFVEGKLLQWRDESGDSFKEMNKCIDMYLSRQRPDGTVRESNERVFRHCAIMIKNKINPDGDSWNTASYEQLKWRQELQADIQKFLRLGYVKDFEGLKSLIRNL